MSEDDDIVVPGYPHPEPADWAAKAAEFLAMAETMSGFSDEDTAQRFRDYAAFARTLAQDPSRVTFSVELSAASASLLLCEAVRAETSVGGSMGRLLELIEMLIAISLDNPDHPGAIRLVMSAHQFNVPMRPPDGETLGSDSEE